MENKTQSVIDMGEAITLSTFGFNLIRLEQSPRGFHKLFVFDTTHPHWSNSTIKGTLESYYRRELQIDAFSFYSKYRDIKLRIKEFEELHPEIYPPRKR